MTTSEPSIKLEAETLEGALEAAKSSGLTLSEWINDAADRALATERGLTGVDDLHDELEEEPVDLPAEVEAEFGDNFLATP